MRLACFHSVGLVVRTDRIEVVWWRLSLKCISASFGVAVGQGVVFPKLVVGQGVVFPLCGRACCSLQQAVVCAKLEHDTNGAALQQRHKLSRSWWPGLHPARSLHCWTTGQAGASWRALLYHAQDPVLSGL